MPTGHTDGLLADWSQRHEGMDPSGIPLLPSWLRLADAAARPLHGIAPDVISAAGALAAGAGVAVAARGRPGVAAGLVLTSCLLDGTDGAVASATGRVSAHGRTWDSCCDRVSETCYLSALVVAAGVPRRSAYGIAGLSAALELVRLAAGHHRRLTVWERPSRVITTVVGLGSAGISPGATWWTGRVVAWVALTLAAVGTVQVTVLRDGPSSSGCPDGARGARPRSWRSARARQVGG